MFKSARKRDSGGSGVAVDIAPLIDVVFILLIFFLVTATFVRPTGIEVDRPRAVHTQSLQPRSFRVSVSGSGAVYADGKDLTLDQLRTNVTQFTEQSDDGSVVLIADKRASAGRLVEVMDAIKAGGGENVALAADQQGGG